MRGNCNGWLGRLASDLATGKMEANSEDTQFMLTVELALEKIYGQVAVHTIEVEQVKAGQIAGLPAGEAKP